MEPGAEKERFIIMKPAAPDLYKGVFHSETVLPSDVGGTWYPKLPADTELAKGPIVLHFHGGSFLWGFGRTDIGDSGFSGATLASKLGHGTYALLVQYRLASDPANPFPAAIQDALTAYAYLLSKNIPASRIVVSGDSAGAILTLALLRYLASEESVFPTPGACLLFAPSVDLVFQGDAQPIDSHRNQKTDFLTSRTLMWGVSSFLPAVESRDDPYFAPARQPFAIETPIWLEGATAEVLIDTYHDFISGMQSIESNRIEFYEVPHAPHDILLIGHLLGWKTEAEKATEVANDFLRSVDVSEAQ